MTEQENKAIKWMKNVRDDAVATLDHIAKEEPNVSPMLYAGRKEKAETIIKGFEELEQYRAIGTVEQIKNAMKNFKSKEVVEISETVIDFKCPCCGSYVYSAMENGSGNGDRYCANCGQKLDWGDENDD